MNGLVPAIIQDADTAKVLMLGFMNREAYDKTVETGKVTFFSRTKNRLWTKGEESGNFLNVVSMKEDCDKDTLLIQVHPVGPVCHTGTDTCWGEKNEQPVMFLKLLQDFIDKRHAEMLDGYSTTSLFKYGVYKMAKKVGQEAAETIIEVFCGPDEFLLSIGEDVVYILIIPCFQRKYKPRHPEFWRLCGKNFQSGEDQTCSSACFRSAVISPMFSRPTEMRIRPPSMPAAFSCSSVSWR